MGKTLQIKKTQLIYSLTAMQKAFTKSFRSLLKTKRFKNKQDTRSCGRLADREEAESPSPH